MVEPEKQKLRLCGAAGVGRKSKHPEKQRQPSLFSCILLAEKKRRAWGFDYPPSKLTVFGKSKIEEIYGKRILINDTFKENLGGKTKVVQVCQTETDRVQGLDKWFGITLTDD